MSTHTTNTSVRETQEYKDMTRYNAVAWAEGFEEGTEAQTLAAWQYLHDTKLGYSLQGFFGRTLTAMIQEGVIER
jgi:hypothetical protein